MNYKEKNLLDLKHSLYSTKASLFFSIGAGGGIAIFFGLLGIDVKAALLTANVWFAIFAWISIIHFSRCEEIQRRIEDCLKKEG